MSETVYCTECGQPMEGPADGIGYWCETESCVEDSKKIAKKLFESTQKKYTESELQAAISEAVEKERKESQEHTKGLQHNLDVIKNELIQLNEAQMSHQAWDRVSLALEGEKDG